MIAPPSLHASPFRHWTWGPIFGQFDYELAASEALSHRANYPSDWVRYDNDCERRKSACRSVDKIGPSFRALFSRLNSQDFADYLSKLTGVDALQLDPTLHGAGAHIVDPGGWLSPHLDYGLHPHLPGLERRVNLILFLTGGRPEHGGAFELWDDGGFQCQRRVYPSPGHAVAWCPGDTEFHGTERLSPSSQPRVAIAIYYLAPARLNAVRKRALFVPHRG